MRILTPDDFLWSVKLGAQLRVLTYQNDFEYVYQQDNDTRIRYRKIIKCGAGHCILCNPDVCGRGMFWVLKINDLNSQIENGKLILNNIPANWSELKLLSNR